MCVACRSTPRACLSQVLWNGTVYLPLDLHQHIRMSVTMLAHWMQTDVQAVDFRLFKLATPTCIVCSGAKFASPASHTLTAVSCSHLARPQGEGILFYVLIPISLPVACHANFVMSSSMHRLSDIWICKPLHVCCSHLAGPQGEGIVLQFLLSCHQHRLAAGVHSGGLHPGLSQLDGWLCSPRWGGAHQCWILNPIQGCSKHSQQQGMRQERDRSEPSPLNSLQRV